MALDFAHGAIQTTAGAAIGTTYTVSGLSFQLKALRVYWVGIQSATDATSTTLDSMRGVGFAVSTSSRRCVVSVSGDAAGAALCATAAMDDSVMVRIAGDGTIAGKIDLDAILSDGFRLIVDAVMSNAYTIFWEAWGGSDITVAAVGDIAEPAATGNVDYTVTGFVAGATDQVVMFAGVQSTAALNTGNANDSGMHVGFATSGAAADNVTVCGNSDDGSATMDTDGYCQDGECLSMITIGGGNPNARAQMTQFGTDNYRLNWIARATTNRRSIFLGIKGGNWKAGSYVIDTTAINNTATVSGLAFAPIGMSLIVRTSGEQTAGTSDIRDRISLGSGSSPSSRRTMGGLDQTIVSTSEIFQFIEYDQVIAGFGNTGALISVCDIDAMLSDGFRNIVDVAGGSATEWQGFLAFGSVAAAAQNSFFEVRVPAYA